jgi:hypothetical protein
VTITEPIPDLQWGKGNWQDYVSNWRTRDTGWMQERLILRYQTTALRNTDWPAPQAGQVTFNGETGLLEMWSSAKNAWLRSLMFQYLLSNKDDAAGVSLFHTGSGGKGVQLTPTSLLVDAPTTNFLNGVHTVDATGMTLKVGARTAKLSTDATALVVDSPLKATSVAADSAAIAGAISAGSLAAASATITASLTMTGATINGGTFTGAVNGTTITGSGAGNIGGVALAGGVLTAPSGVISAGAYLRGDANTGFLSYRAAGGAVSAPTVTVDNTYVRFRANNGMPVDKHDGNHTGGWVGVVFTSDPGAANAPTGSILLT